MAPERERIRSSEVVLHYQAVQRGNKTCYRFDLGSHHCDLTPTEFNYLRLIVTDPASVKVMARQYGVKVQTVKNICGYLYQKFGITGERSAKMTRLVSHLVEKGILEYPPRVRREAHWYQRGNGDSR